MIFRLIAMVVFAAGVVLLVLFLGLLGEGPGSSIESKHLRAMKERKSAPLSYTPFTTDSFTALPHRWTWNRYARIEQRGVSFIGWAQRTLPAGDGDMHLELTPAPHGENAPDTLYVTAEVTPWWRHRSQAWSYESLLGVLRPNDGGTTRWAGGPQQVRVSGWLLYDFQYDRPNSSWTMQHGAPRLTGWEIHPVTRIEAWDDAAHAWLEVKP